MKYQKTVGQTYVYVLGDKAGPQKIGIANDPYRRLLALQTGSALELVLASATAVPSEIVYAVEDHAHWLLRAKHARGEWFSCPPQEAVEAIQSAILAVENGTAEALQKGDLVGNGVKPLLDQIGWSERELATRLGAHRNTVNDWTNDRRKPPVIVLGWLQSLADAHVALPVPEWRA